MTRKSDLEDDADLDDEILEELYSVPVRRRIKALTDIQNKYEETELEYRKEVLDLERKYLAKYG